MNYARMIAFEVAIVDKKKLQAIGGGEDGLFGSNGSSLNHTRGSRHIQEQNVNRLPVLVCPRQEN